MYKKCIAPRKDLILNKYAVYVQKTSLALIDEKYTQKDDTRVVISKPSLIRYKKIFSLHMYCTELVCVY